MKKLSVLLILVILIVSLSACGGSKGTEIPDIFGVSYTDAVEILEGEGFEVKAIEADVEEISQKLLYPLEKVSKGVVFKIDDYILDGNGNLTKDYDVFYDGEFISEDDSIIIYYAKEDYELKKEIEDTTDYQEPATEAAKESEEETEPTTTETEKDKENTDENGLGKDFKNAMDSYEEFMDEYVEFMKKYNKNPSDITLLADYAKYMADYAEFAEDFEKWEDEEMNSAETAYYAKVQGRVTQKLLEVAA